MLKIQPNEEILNKQPFYSNNGADIRKVSFGYVFHNVSEDYFIISEEQMHNLIRGFSGVPATVKEPLMGRIGPNTKLLRG